MRSARPPLALPRPRFSSSRGVVGIPPKEIPPHRSRAFCGVVDALGNLTSEEKRAVLGAVLELVPAPRAATAAPRAATAAPRATQRRRVMHCTTCHKPGHDRRSCPVRLKAQLKARELAASEARA